VGTLAIQSEYLTLAQALKASGLAESGGQAKQIVRAGAATINGAVELRPGRKLRAGDRFAIEGQAEWTLSSSIA
jgi:ribosome-associated protein